MERNDITIEVKNVCKSFRAYSDKSHTFKDRVLFRKRNKYSLQQVLNQISFEVVRGQALGLIGHNGSGKSTTLKLLNRILYPDSGEIKMHGRVSSLIELGAGFHPDMTGRENIFINASIFGLTRKEIEARLDQIIRFSELEQYIDNPVRTYSSGMYMRLAFAIAINVDADILLIDEILAVGDSNFQKKCFDKLKEVKKTGTTIVIVSHNMTQLQSICDRVLWLEKGRIEGDGDASSICEAYLSSMEIAAQMRRMKEEGVNNVESIPPVLKYPPAEIAEFVGPYVRRSGNMLVRFTHIRVLNSHGESQKEFQLGDDIVIEYETVMEQPNIRGHILFNIIDPSGGWLASIDSYNIHGEYHQIRDIHAGKVIIESPTITKGEYVIEALIQDEKGENMDCITHFIYIDFYSPEGYGIRPLAVNRKWIFAEGLS